VALSLPPATALLSPISLPPQHGADWTGRIQEVASFVERRLSPERHRGCRVWRALNVTVNGNLDAVYCCGGGVLCFFDDGVILYSWSIRRDCVEWRL
jgi:hypothetical protein